ncbi:hypothetical protein GOBAR_AA37038 [Gossypium barbadense]|uniref:Cytochrome b-c1 complex subunit 8 n=1 Tax=Gossypium barbadense TaxID=3634 RepID=A0A2P5VXV5_GOSBA|nr:hypothetical protein GOBAR_AA37038 [Gossypium barbadense]
MGKQPVKMRAVVYALSPFQQKIMGGLWKDLPGKISHKVSENWISATLLLAPLVGTDHSVFLSSMERIALACAWQQFRHHFRYVQNFKEKEKLEHRY